MLHKALRLIRVFHDLSQKELSNKLGISKSYLSQIESGNKKPTLTLLESYADIFDIPVSSIMFFSENIDNKVDTENIRIFISSKILTLLNFIADRSGHSNVNAT